MSAHQERLIPEENSTPQTCPISNCEHPKFCAINEVISKALEYYRHKYSINRDAIKGCSREEEINMFINQLEVERNFLNKAFQTTQERIDLPQSSESSEPTTPSKFKQETPNLRIKK